MHNELLIKPLSIINSAKSSHACSKVFTYKPTDASVSAQRGEISVVIAAKKMDVMLNDWESIVKEAFFTLRDTYYETSHGTNVQAMDSALEAATSLLTQKVAGYRSDGNIPLELHIGVISIWAGSFVFKTTGPVFFALYRNNEFIDFSNDTILQETVESDDVFILGTKSFGEHFNVSKLQDLLGNNVSGDWQSLIKGELEHIEDESMVVGLALHIVVDEVVDDAEVINIAVAQKEQLSLWEKVRIILPKSSITSVVSRLSMVRTERDIFVSSEHAPSRLKIPKKILAFILLVILLVISLFYTYKARREVVVQERVDVQEEVVLEKLDEVASLATLDAAVAFSSLEEIKDGLGDVKGSTKINDSIVAIEKEIFNVDSLDGALQVRGGYEGGFVYLTNTLITVSPQGTISLDDDTETYATLSNVQLLQTTDDGVYVYNDDSGIWYMPQDLSVSDHIVSQEGQWGQVVALATFGDNVYVLTPDHNQLKKYLGLGGGLLGTAIDYIEDPVSFADAIDVAIDGHVYVLYADGKVEKFLGGKRTDFTLSGTFAAIDSPKKIRVYEGFNHLYLLADGGINVFSIDGEYLHRLETSLGKIEDFDVRRDESRMVIGIDGVLYEYAIVFDE